MMIKIGETHTVFPCAALDPTSDRDAMIRSEVLATEAVKRQIEAHEDLLIAIGMGWDLDGVIEQSVAALAPFTETEEGR